MAWVEHVRSDSNKVRGDVFVTLSDSGGVAFSTAFTVQIICTATHATVHVDPIRRNLGFTFHKHDNADTYRILQNGKARSKRIQCKGLFDAYPWLVASRYALALDGDSGIWYIDVGNAQREVVR